MRVLHLTRNFPPRVNGGMSTAVGALVAASRRVEITCGVISFDAWRPKKGSRSPAMVEGNVLRVSSPAHDVALAQFGGAFDADVIHVHDGMLFPYAARIAAAPTVFTVHVAQAVMSRLRELETPTQSQLAEAIALSEANAVTVASRHVADDLDVARAHVVPLALLDPPEVGPRDGGILFVGRFADAKGLDTLIEALPRIPGISVAGGLPDNRRAEAKWRERFAGSGAELLGWLTPEALQRQYRMASILAAPSWYETYGLAVLEAMGHGLAVVASRVGGVTDLIEDGATGMLVPPRDPDALAAALNALHCDPVQARALGDRAAAHVRASCLWAHRIDRLRTVYDEVCS